VFPRTAQRVDRCSDWPDDGSHPPISYPIARTARSANQIMDPGNAIFRRRGRSVRNASHVATGNAATGAGRSFTGRGNAMERDIAGALSNK